MEENIQTEAVLKVPRTRSIGKLAWMRKPEGGEWLDVEVAGMDTVSETKEARAALTEHLSTSEDDINGVWRLTRIVQEVRPTAVQRRVIELGE